MTQWYSVLLYSYNFVIINPGIISSLRSSIVVFSASSVNYSVLLYRYSSNNRSRAPIYNILHQYSSIGFVTGFSELYLYCIIWNSFRDIKDVKDTPALVAESLSFTWYCSWMLIWQQLEQQHTLYKNIFAILATCFVNILPFHKLSYHV